MCIIVPVHEVNEHLWILLMFFHLNSVGKNHVKVEHQILDLQFQKCITGHTEALYIILAAPHEILYRDCYIPALGRVYRAAPDPLQRMSGWS